MTLQVYTGFTSYVNIAPSLISGDGYLHSEKTIMTTKEVKEIATARVAATRAAIKSHREALGITQDVMAAAIGVDRFAIIRIENGRRVLRMNELCRIAAVMGIEPDVLMRGGGE